MSLIPSSVFHMHPIQAMLPFRNWIGIVILCVFYVLDFPAKCVGNERKCFKVEEKVLCYFSPNVTSNYTWEEAWTECKDRGATLPYVPNKAIAGVLERYADSQKVDYRFWTSGRRIESKEWKWINGQSYNGSTVRKRHASDSYAVVTKDFIYLEQYPIYEKNYICHHFGSQCQSEDAIQLSEGCLILSSKEKRNVSDARNDCLERGGDLPVIINNEDLKKFEEVFLEFKDHAQIWIGLRRNWWTWNTTDDSADIRFSNWVDRQGALLYKNCMVVDVTSFKWRQVNCSDQERVLCQTVVPEKSNENDSKSSSVGGMVAGILIGILVVALAVVIAVLLLRKRIRLPFDGFKRVKSGGSPMAEQNTVEEFRSTASSDVKVTTGGLDQGNCAELGQGRSTEPLRGHYEKLNRCQVEKRKSYNVEPCQGQKVDKRQIRKSEPCQGYQFEPCQNHSVEQRQSHKIEPSRGHEVEPCQGHKIEPSQCENVEPNEDQNIEVFQGQRDDQFQDHYAKIASAQTTDANDDEEQSKTIVYAKLEFDDDASKNVGSNDQHVSAETAVNSTDGGVSDYRASKISQQKPTRSSNGSERHSTEVDAHSDIIAPPDLS